LELPGILEQKYIIILSVYTNRKGEDDRPDLVSEIPYYSIPGTWGQCPGLSGGAYKIKNPQGNQTDQQGEHPA
jgi:hypothetical protein